MEISDVQTDSRPHSDAAACEYCVCFHEGVFMLLYLNR